MTTKALQRFMLNDKTALITGSGGLLGREHAIALAETGANVILTDIKQVCLKDLKESLKRSYPDQQFYANEMDVTDENSIQSVVSEFKNKFINIDILINNAALNPKVSNEVSSLENTRLENFSLDIWNKEISVGLTGAMLCSKYFGAEMAKRRSGVILNIASDLAVIAPDQRLYSNIDQRDELKSVKPVTYSVIKHGLIGLTKYLATYWAEKGVRVNALSPGGVYNHQPSDFVDKIKKLIPLNRMANADEYRGSIQFLCSDASSYMTGHNLIVEGGRSIW